MVCENNLGILHRPSILDHNFVFLIVSSDLVPVVDILHNLDQAHVMGWMHRCLRLRCQDQVCSALRGFPIHIAIVRRHFLAGFAILIEFHIPILNHHLSKTLENHQPSNSAHYSCDGITR